MEAKKDTKSAKTSLEKKSTKPAIEKIGTLDLIAKIVDLTSNTGAISTTGPGRSFIRTLANRLGIEPSEALMLSVFVDQCEDSRIQVRDIARHFNCRNVAVLAKDDVIESLVRRRVIARRKDSDGDISYRLPHRTIEALKDDRLPEKDNYEGLTTKSVLSVVEELLHQRSRDEICDDDLEECLNEIIEKNQHIDYVCKLKGLHLDYTDLVLFLAMTTIYINDHDDRICRSDIDDYFDRRDYHYHVRDLEDGSHTLMNLRLVEHSCVDGQIDSSSWCLTNYAKYDFYADLNLKAPSNVRANLTHYDDITEKKLFYSPSVTKQVNQLRDLLEHDKMERVLKRLADKGMRQGFTCIFYGGPGTGKTETVLQLARETKRDIMLVDIPSIRSKWVGEQEKNIKAVFDRYRRAVESVKSSSKSGKTVGEAAPILLFNEADAILNKRFEGGLSCADKEENSMQNIILQEMENLEGIMIATTNLTGSLDDAFERRFLYKIEFDKPTPKERLHIWRAMLPDLTEKDALTLAERFDFSGGQIENITRKRVITDILDERDTLDLESIIESCKTELLNNKKSHTRVGF